MRKRAILILGVALLIATAGVIYAHWQDTLKVDATVSTGDINVIWQSYGTDDDGKDNTGFVDSAAQTLEALSATDDGGPGVLAYDAWGTESSADPAEMWRCGFGTCGYKLNGEFGLDRYDKDVGKCEVAASSDAKTLTVTITGAYPSYHCTVHSQLSNEGTVPVKATGFTLTTPAGYDLGYVGTEYIPAAWGTTADCNTPGNEGKCPMGLWTSFPVPLGYPVMTFDFADGTACGNQLDPFGVTGDMDLNAVWFHIEQGDDPDTPEIENGNMDKDFVFHWEQDFVNWNEWDASMCTVTINGVTYP